MSDTAESAELLREKIMSEPEVVLEDPDVMRALISADEGRMGNNVVDLRSVAMGRLETRLGQLEDTHQTVISAAYENLAGTNQVHRAVLKMLDPLNFEDFLLNLGGEVSEILRVDSVRLVLETHQEETDASLDRLGTVLAAAAPGVIAGYLGATDEETQRKVTLRSVSDGADWLYLEGDGHIQSEAAMLLDFGPGKLPGMLLMGAQDPDQFQPSQGTDLLTFFAGVLERSMRRWLA
ncbi:DUF484 family protein [Halocynthiibacter namhaensis]|uniref:DUF484 family protein n=1 Tax=Halocynthiibacter namhaensis TaxID=1290553 RepID=UPI0005797927|nr:DUF484 family protein [Halocynthiibacter namhaensis]